MKPRMMRLTSSDAARSSSKFWAVENPRRCPTSNSVCTSQHEPWAIERWCRSSVLPLRPELSAMLAGTETAARRTWAVRPNRSSAGHERVSDRFLRPASWTSAKPQVPETTLRASPPLPLQLIRRKGIGIRLLLTAILATRRLPAPLTTHDSRLTTHDSA